MLALCNGKMNPVENRPLTALDGYVLKLNERHGHELYCRGPMSRFRLAVLRPSGCRRRGLYRRPTVDDLMRPGSTGPCPRDGRGRAWALEVFDSARFATPGQGSHWILARSTWIAPETLIGFRP